MIAAAAVTAGTGMRSLRGNARTRILPCVGMAKRRRREGGSASSAAGLRKATKQVYPRGNDAQCAIRHIRLPAIVYSRSVIQN
jgi:hypothetical protein